MNIFPTIAKTRYQLLQSYPFSEAATGGVLQKKVFLEISQNSQENTCARVSFLIKLQASVRNISKSKNVSPGLIPKLRKICVDQRLGKYYCTLKNPNKVRHWQTKNRWWVWETAPEKFCNFYSHLSLET